MYDSNPDFGTFDFEWAQYRDGIILSAALRPDCFNLPEITDDAFRNFLAYGVSI